MQTIDVESLSNDFAKVLALVESGDSVTLRRAQQPIVTIEPIRKKISLFDLKPYDLGEQLAPIKSDDMLGEMLEK